MPIRWVLGNPSILQPCLVGPFVGLLSLPSPLDPTLTSLLIRDRLCFPELPQERLVAGAESAGFAAHPGAASYSARTRVGSVVSAPDTASVEISSAISSGGRPFTDDCPEARGL